MTLWTVACQAPLSLGFPKQEHWSGLPFSFLRELPDSGIKHPSPVWRADSLLLSHQGSLEDTVQRCIYLCPWPQRSVGSSEEAGVLLRSTDALLGRGAVPGVSDRQGLSSFFLFPSVSLPDTCSVNHRTFKFNPKSNVQIYE